MRKFIPILLMILSLPLCGKAEQGYVIDGNVTEIPDGTVMYLRLVGPPTKDIDSTRIENGRFRFTGVHNGTPEWALISIKGAFLPACDFYLENGNIEIKGKRYSVIATGTETNSQYNYFKTNINPIFTDIVNTHTRISNPGNSKEQVDSLKAQIKELEREVLDKEIKFIHDYPDSPVSLRIVEYICRNASSDNILRYVSYLSEKQQATPAVASLKDYASRKKRTENGALAPAFTLPDVIQRVYREPDANRFMGTLAPFIHEHLHLPQVEALVLDEFDSFMRRNVMQYPDAGELPIYFVGSVAAYFAHQLHTVSDALALSIAGITPDPMDGLIKYHSSKPK